MPGSICVITARGGSKRIPRKNMREFCGKPIIAYSIEAALESKLFDEVMVSTDDEDIAQVAKSYGAKVPFMRSAETSNDYTVTEDVIVEVLGCYKNTLGKSFDTVCCVYPTAPFVTADELREAFGKLTDENANAVVPVTEFDFPPQRAFKVDENGFAAYAHPEFATARSQDLEPLCHDCGRFYFAKTDAMLEHRDFIMPGCAVIRIPPERVQDIDTEDDWRLAELKYEALQRLGL